VGCTITEYIRTTQNTLRSSYVPAVYGDRSSRAPCDAVPAHEAERAPCAAHAQPHRMCPDTRHIHTHITRPQHAHKSIAILAAASAVSLGRPVHGSTLTLHCCAGALKTDCTHQLANLRSISRLIRLPRFAAPTTTTWCGALIASPTPLSSAYHTLAVAHAS